MLYGLLNADPKRFVTNIGEISLYGLIGYAVVFLGIAFLIFIVWLVGKIVARGVQLKKQPAKTTVEAPMVVPAVTASNTEEIDEETVAVIMAALMAYYEKNNPKCEFTLKRIKRMRRNDYA